MARDPKLPDFDAFCRWLSNRLKEPGARTERYDTLLAARLARSEFLRARRHRRAGRGTVAVLQLLAAADRSEAARPPEMRTARGFRVTLAHDEATSADAPSICILVRCPPELLPAIEGETAYLWNGTQRFELGDFDAEGKAIGALPAGVEISLLDFAQGRVKLEEPPTSEG